MRSISRCLWVAAVAVTVWATPARAADKLESIVKQQDLSREDKARLDQEVQERAQRLVSAADETPGEREDARARLVETTRISGATDPALSYYAEQCANHLSLVLLSDKRPAAEDAALVLRMVNRKETARSLVTGLRSPFEAVQYHCAVGIRNLHKQIADDRGLVTDALDALGDVGSKSRNEALLRAVYEAINFAGSIQNFPGSDQQANALAKVLKGRLKAIESGSQDEIKDAAGYQAALAIGQVKTSIEAKRELLAILVDMLEAQALRYADTNKDYFPTLGRLVSQLEQAIHQILRSENTNPPSQTVTSIVKERPSKSRASAALAAVNELRSIMKRDPWRVG